MEIAFGFGTAIAIELIILGLLRFFLFYTVVNEKTCQVFTLFGQVIHVCDQPGLHFLWPKLSWRALVINILGRIYTLDLRMDQTYLRSQPVNSEEGAPMGIGIWYEMYVSDPIAFLFRNTDPYGSLAANVSNATVRTLSNLPLVKLLEDRRALSHSVRQEVSQKSQDWGYKLGSVYMRKVHFRDQNMITEIEAKVVNRLKQVTASIRQEGENQVQIITSSAQRSAAVEFARAAAIRPKIVGEALQKICKDPEIARAMFTVLETNKILESSGELILVPAESGIMSSLLATRTSAKTPFEKSK